MDYAEVIMEVRERSGIPGVVERAAYLVQRAEAMLEKSLKVGAMETVATLVVDAEGEATLPTDFLQLRTGSTVAVRGNKLLTGLTEGEVTIGYYAKLPSIVTAGTNWLLASEPEAYVQATLLQAFLVFNKPQEAAGTLQIVGSIVKGLQDADIRARFLNRRIEFGGAVV